MKAAPIFTLLLLCLMPARADDVGDAMETFVKEGHIAGAVTLVGKKDQIYSLEAVGYQVLETRKPMETGSLFWIASMTKPMTALAVLMLHDDRRLDINHAVEDYLPEFKGQMLLKEKTDAQTVVVKPARPITIKDLLTHTSGLAEHPAIAANPKDTRSLGELVTAYALTPLQSEPGSKWSYSNPGINTLGRIIEVVTGEEYGKAMATYVFRPLLMRNTTFWPSARQMEKLAVSYKMDDELRRLVPSGIPALSEPYSNTKRTALPAGGLFSTAEDLHKLYAMLVNGGEVGRKRHLRKETLDLMHQNHTAEMKAGFVEGMGMGLGAQVVTRPTGVTAKLRAGTAGHGGAHGTQGWYDPASGAIQIMLIQRAGLPNGDASPMRQAFHDAAVRILEGAALLEE